MTTAAYTTTYVVDGSSTLGPAQPIEVFVDATSTGGNLSPGDTVLVSFTTAGGNSDIYTAEYIGQADGNSPVIVIVSNNTGTGAVDIPDGTLIYASNDGSLSGTTLADNNYSSTVYTTCFASGTLIATPDGERAVETLAVNALILTADGRAVPVKWIGRQTLHKLFMPAERFEPVRVKAGALGGGLPHTDLVLTAEHALILDGLAINAGALVNGSTIAFDPADSLPDRVTYYHVETEAHDVILANGAPAESYVDYIQRSAFDNYGEYLALYGDDRTIREMDLTRVSAARLVPESIRERLGGKNAA